MRVMKSMELSDDQKLDYEKTSVSPDMPVKPQFPYGLRICLTKGELEKLNLDASSAMVGGIVHLHALARVTSVSSDTMETVDGKKIENERVELQIEEMEIESEDAENEEADAPKAKRARILYDRSR